MGSERPNFDPDEHVKNWQKAKQKQELTKAKKKLKRHRDPKKPRRRDWDGFTAIDDDEWDDSIDISTERIMPLDERDRRQSVVEIAEAMKAGDDDSTDVAPSIIPGTVEATVIEVSTGLCRVLHNGQILLCELRGALSAQDTGYSNVVAVGDKVLISETEHERGIVEAVLPRHGILARPDSSFGHLQQIIAANVDQLLIVAAWRDPAIWLELIDRYLITAERNGLTPILCVNKIDLADNPNEIETTLQPYRALDVEILLTSAETDTGIDALRAVLNDKTTVVAGLSGVGKSSLLNAVQSGLNIRANAISDVHHEGTHTTTQARMWTLDDGGYVIDTPGIRAFGLTGLIRAELVSYYPMIAAFAPYCHFADCSHQHEPDCAVQQAVERGALSADRLHSYIKIWETLPT
jgi:ribosome biogenesis GTPase